MPSPPPDLIIFDEYAPDVTPINTSRNAVVNNVVPTADGYGPFRSLVALTQALPSACRGVFQARNEDQTIAIFAGTANALYRLVTTDNITFAWTRVGDYTGSGLDADKIWQFAQYNTLVFAVQGNVNPQVYQLGISTAFADLGGAPPKAGHVTIVNQFVVLSDLTLNPARVRWSGLGLPTQWTAGVSNSDFQDMQSGGYVRHVDGGDQYGLIFQDSAIRSLTFAPGSPQTFNIVLISAEDGLLAEYSVIKASDRIYYYSYQGFKVIPPGGYPQAIGKERVDSTFLADLDQDNMQLMVAATDPNTTRVYWTYKSLTATRGISDKIMCYDWAIGQSGRWTLILGQDNQFLTQLSPLNISGSIPAGSRLSVVPFRWFLCGFDSTGRLGTFSGANLEAIIETPAVDLGDRYAITFMRPMTDAGRGFGSIGTLDTAQGTVTYSTEQSLNAQGNIPCRVETRYARGRLRIPSGTTWSYAMGIRPTAVPNQGDR